MESRTHAETAGGESVSPRARSGPRFGARLRAVVPVALLALALSVFTVVDARVFNLIGDNPPPADEVDVSRVQFKEGRIVVHVRNPQTEKLTIASVAVDDAIVNFTFDGPRTLGRLAQTTLEVPYPWIAGEPYAVGITTSTGIETVTEIPAAVESRDIEPSGLLGYALIGLLVGLLPVALGLMWLPSLRTLGDTALAGFMALTAGLLTFLTVDSLFEALELQSAVPAAFGGIGLVVLGVAVSFIGLAAVADRLTRGHFASSAEKTGDTKPVAGGFALATAIAIGIGLHNLGEGLAIGTSFALGELAFGSLLIVGFTVHNITEGLGIAAPLADDRAKKVGFGRLAGLAAIAGLPAVAGAWIGGFITSNVLGTLFFAIAAGAAAQVVYEVVSYIRRRSGLGWRAPAVAGGFVAGIAIMYVTSLIAG